MVYFASNLHGEIGETSSQSLRSEHFWIFQYWGVPLPALRGEHIFEKRIQNEHLTAGLLTLVHQPNVTK